MSRQRRPYRPVWQRRPTAASAVCPVWFYGTRSFVLFICTSAVRLPALVSAWLGSSQPGPCVGAGAQPGLAGLVRFSKPETLYVTYAKLSISDICAVTKPKLSMAKLHRRNCLQFVCMAKLDRLLTLNKTASPHPTQNYPSNAYKPHRSIHIYIYIMF